MEYIGLTAGVITLLISFFGFYLAMKKELRKNSERSLETSLEEEKRHSAHEKRFLLLGQRVSQMNLIISSKLDEINKNLNSLYELVIEHIKDE